MAYDKVVDSGKLDSAMTATADAIRGKTGGADSIAWDESTGFADAVGGIEVGERISVQQKDVNFYDYDGTRLYSYTVAEAQALTELPPLPTRRGLICQRWNWTLDGIKSQNRAVDVGATYTTDDGKTRLYITIATKEYMTVPLYFNQTAENGVIIDWGDGSAVETLSGTEYVNTSHTYADTGDYVISLDVTSGTMLLGSGDDTNSIMGVFSETTPVYRNMLWKIEIGNNVTAIGKNAFRFCYSLKNVSLSNNVGRVEFSAFSGCYGLGSIIIPWATLDFGNYAHNNNYSLKTISIHGRLKTIGYGMFNNCYAVANVVLPDTVQTIKQSAFNGCRGLSSVIIPSSVTQIDSKAFISCVNVKTYDFTAATAVPTLSNVDAFSAISSDCVIKVPAALYDEWTTATNWSTYASRIVGV